MSLSIEITVGARNSALSRAQVEEVAKKLPSVKFTPIWVETTGDRDLTTPLSSMEKTDFFTKEIDQMQLKGECRISIHSAKDLPDPLPKGLIMVALTKAVNPTDSLVFREGEAFYNLPEGSTIGTSSERRMEMVKSLRPDLKCVDVRGSIEQRLALLDEKKVDGLVLAEAALMRLGLTSRNRIQLQGATAPRQGCLAILAREDDKEMQKLFAPLDIRQKKVLFLGLNPQFFKTEKTLVHYPVIQVNARAVHPHFISEFPSYTHIIFTSQTSVTFYLKAFPPPKDKILISVGKGTASALERNGFKPHFIAQNESQEGIIEVLKLMDLKGAHIFWPRSSMARSLIENYFEENKIKASVCDLYDTISVQPKPTPNLDDFDEIVFTAPSTVEGFMKVFKAMPRGKMLTAIGPVTSNALKAIIN